MNSERGEGTTARNRGRTKKKNSKEKRRRKDTEIPKKKMSDKNRGMHQNV